MCSLSTIRQWQTPYSEVWGIITAKVNVCRVPKRFPQEVRGLSTGRSEHPDQLAPHILQTTTTGEDLRVSKLTRNSGFNFRNRSDSWSKWPSQCSRLWSQYLLVWVWISWKCIHYRMSVSNGWVLPLKKKSVLSHHSRPSKTYKTEKPFSFGV